MDPEKWCPVDLKAQYKVAIVSFLSTGGTRIYDFPGLTIERTLGPSDFEVLSRYVKKHSPLEPKIENRLVINYSDVLKQ